MGEYGIRERRRRSGGEEGEVRAEHLEGEARNETGPEVATPDTREGSESETLSPTEAALEEALEELRDREARERRVTEMVEEALSELEDSERAEGEAEDSREQEEIGEHSEESQVREKEAAYEANGELVVAVETQVQEVESEPEIPEEATERPESEETSEPKIDEPSEQREGEAQPPPSEIPEESVETETPETPRPRASEMEEDPPEGQKRVGETEEVPSKPGGDMEDYLEERTGSSEEAVEEEVGQPQEVSDVSEPSHSPEVSEPDERDAEETGPEEGPLEDLRQRVEEILEGADLEEDYYVDPLSGKRLYRGSEFFPESEEDRARRRLRELFSELSEEEQEAFKEWVRSQVRTEEDLEELMERYAERALRSPEQEEARAYLRGEREERPGLLRELTALETERQWASLVEGVARETNEPEAEERTGLRRLEGAWMKEALSESAAEGWDHERLSEVLSEAGRRLPESSRIAYVDVSELPPLKGALERARERLEGEGVRVGLVEERLYLWRPDTTPTKLENVYSDLYYYFRDRDTFQRYVVKVGRALGFEEAEQRRTLEHVNRLALQTMGNPSDGPCINVRLRRIRGSYINLMNDLCSETLEALETRISRITGWNGHGGVKNPRFPQGSSFEKAVARISATAFSDCTIEPNGVVKYAESDLARLKRVEQNLKEFGDINLRPRYVKSERHYLSHIPFIIGKILMSRGVPSGDRTIQNPGLHASMKKGPESVAEAYIEDMTPQDGCIGAKIIIWRRANALDGGKKNEKYGLQSAIGDAEKSLIKDQGRKEKGKSESWVLSRGRLAKLERNPEFAETAKRLSRTIADNPNRLIIDEVELVKSLGVGAVAVPSDVRYYPKTGRVTAVWQAYTTGLKEAIKLGVIAPPNDIQKRRQMRDLITGRPRTLKIVLRELEKKGMSYEKWWE
jgi:hypothetical protein